MNALARNEAADTARPNVEELLSERDLVSDEPDSGKTIH